MFAVTAHGLKSPAEIRMFRSWGGDVIGMTGIPEVVFAREAGMDYAAMAVVTNLGAGLTAEPVSHEDVAARMYHALPHLRELTMGAAPACWSRLQEQYLNETIPPWSLFQTLTSDNVCGAGNFLLRHYKFAANIMLNLFARPGYFPLSRPC